MGTWGTGLFGDDVAVNVRDEFLELLASGTEPANATEMLVASNASAVNDSDDGPIFWLALAATQWEYGCLIDDVRDRALALIDGDQGLERWERPADRARRAAEYETLASKLRSQQPPRRLPPHSDRVEVPSKTCVAPDGITKATAFSFPDLPSRMQVILELTVGAARGGGSVCVGNCSHDAIELEWLDNRRLQITHPADLTFESREERHFFCGETVTLLYRPRT